MMWSFASNAISSIRNRSSGDLSQTCEEGSDDDVCSNASRDEVLECPICWESFNMVENVPYVFWCGHTLCKNCVLGLQWAVLKFPTQQVKVPFFISCPWCHILSFRLVYKGNLKYPCKNFFLIWMVERRNGDKQKVVSACVDSHQVWYPKSNFLVSQATNCNLRRASTSDSGLWGPNEDVGGGDGSRHHFPLHKFLDFFVHFTSKFPLVIIFLLIAYFVVPCSAIILVLYLLITILFAIPSFIILYFAYPTIQRLIREITSSDVASL